MRRAALGVAAAVVACLGSGCGLPVAGAKAGAGGGTSGASGATGQPPTVVFADGLVGLETWAADCPGGGPAPAARVVEAPAALRRELEDLRVDAAVRDGIVGTPIAWGDGERILVVVGGQLPNPGYGLVVERVGRTMAGGVRVEARIEPPRRGLLQPQVIATPCRLLRFGGWRAGADPVAVDLSVAR